MVMLVVVDVDVDGLLIAIWGGVFGFADCEFLWCLFLDGWGGDEGGNWNWNCLLMISFSFLFFLFGVLSDGRSFVRHSPLNLATLPPPSTIHHKPP